MIGLERLSKTYYTAPGKSCRMGIHHLRRLQKKENGGSSMKAISRATALFLVLSLSAVAQHAPAAKEQPASDNMMPHPSHSGGAPVTYAELKNTVAELERARQATAKYKDVHVAEAEGYQVVGPDVPGMGVHFILTMEPNGFDIEKPPILLYEKNAAAPGGYTLVGVSYLWNAAEGPDGQPLDPPFPKSLARWHRHDNICVLPHIENPHGLSESQCREQGGHFTAKSQWLVHVWIWKDNPSGVFSPENPALRSDKMM
jgi:hypothetical protein